MGLQGQLAGSKQTVDDNFLAASAASDRDIANQRWAQQIARLNDQSGAWFTRRYNQWKGDVDVLFISPVVFNLNHRMRIGSGIPARERLSDRIDAHRRYSNQNANRSWVCHAGRYCRAGIARH